jgi:hypothetical protein
MSERSESNVGLTDLLARVAWHMRMKYRVEMQDIEITDTPGYWRDREPKMHPGHPLHGCIGCDGPFRATYSYFVDPEIFISSLRELAGGQGQPVVQCCGQG